jgi:zinc/manganese transport system ATP-binding protein
MTVAIRIEAVSFGYNGSPVFRGLSLEIPGAATTAVIGSNGCGKSTLLGLIAGTAGHGRHGWCDRRGAGSAAQQGQ